MGYRSPFGDAEDGSEIFLSTIGCLPDNGIVGFPVVTWVTVAELVVTFALSIGSI